MKLDNKYQSLNFISFSFSLMMKFILISTICLCVTYVCGTSCEPITNTSVFEVPKDLGEHPAYLQETWWYASNLNDEFGNQIGLVVGGMKVSLNCKVDIDEIFSLLVILVNATSQERHAGALLMFRNETRFSSNPYRAYFQDWHMDMTSFVGTTMDFKVEFKFDQNSQDWFYYGPNGRAVLCKNQDEHS